MTLYTYKMLIKLIEYTNDKRDNLNKVLVYLSHNNTCNYDDWLPIKYMDSSLDSSLDINNCCCNHLIENKYLVKNNHNNNVIVVGSKCINTFGEKAINKRNELFDEKHGKKKCPTCKKTVSKAIVEKYKHENNIYHKKCYKNENYIRPDPPPYQEPKPFIPVIKTRTFININTIISFGQFKGKPLSELLKDVNYCDWIKSVKEPSGKLKEIQDYILTI
jgi:hypothetical protein